MLITGDDIIGSACHSAFEKSVVSGVLADGIDVPFGAESDCFKINRVKNA